MVYLAGAWLVLQVADTVIPWLGLDDAVGRVLLIVLIVGFVPTVIASWVFEWTPDGIRFDDEVEVDAAGAVVARRRLDRIIIGVLTIAVVYFAVDEFFFDARQSGYYDGARSIAVLPFEDVSPDGDQAYLSNGIADELRLELQYLEGLRVAGRTSSIRHAKEDTKTIGEVLNVESVLEGSVRKDGDNVRITVQLINVADGFTSWSQPFDRKLDNIFEMQQEIAISVAGALGVRLGVGSVNAFRGAGTQNVEAYEAFMRARSPEPTRLNNEEQIELLERAIQLDPDYAAAWSMLAFRVLSNVWDVDVDRAPEVVERAHTLAAEGVRLDPESAISHAALAWVRAHQFDWIGAEQSNARAIELLADGPTTAMRALFLTRSGRSLEAEEQYFLAVELDPLDGRPHGQLWHVYLAQGRLAEAQEVSNWQTGINIIENNLDIAFNKDDPDALKAAISSMPETNLSYINLYAPILQNIDSPSQVLTLIRDVYGNESLQWPRKLHDIAMAAVYFGDPEFALQVKREEVLINPTRLSALWYPVMSAVRELPAFKDFVAQINLVEYWRAYGWADSCTPLGDNDFSCI